MQTQVEKVVVLSRLDKKGDAVMCINYTESEKVDQTSSMGLFFGMLQATTTLRPVFRTKKLKSSVRQWIQTNMRPFLQKFYLVDVQCQILCYPMLLQLKK